MHALDGKPESCANGFQSFAGGEAFTDESVAFLFGNVFFSDRLLSKRNTPIEAVKQPIGSSIQGG